MAAPTNISFETATVIAALPYDFTQSDINDDGINYTVYYKFTAPIGALVIGAWGWGALTSSYSPVIRVYDHDEVAVLPAIPIINTNAPVQFPVVAGQDYYLKFTPADTTTTGPESLRVQVEVAPTTAIAAGHIGVNDDAAGFPTAFLSHEADHTLINFILDTPSGEQGDTLASGIVALDDKPGDFIKIYDASYAVINTLNYIANTAYIRTCMGGNKFYVGLSKNPNNCEVKTILNTGEWGPTTWTLIGELTIWALAASNNETILYFANAAYGNAIKTWNLSTDSAGAQFAAGITNYIVEDILVLSDDTIIALYSRTNGATQAIHYAANGTILNTYDLGIQGFVIAHPRMAYAIDNPNSFWVWMHTTALLSTFLNIKVSDGSTLTTRLHTVYEGGVLQASPAIPNPTARFGTSNSCPFWIQRASVTPPEPTLLVGGLYYIRDGDHDYYYNDIEKKIPDPMFRIGYIGD